MKPVLEAPRLGEEPPIVAVPPEVVNTDFTSGSDSNTISGLATGAQADADASVQNIIANANINNGHNPPSQGDSTFNYYHDLYLYLGGTPYLWVCGVPLGNLLNDYDPNAGALAPYTGRFKMVVWAGILVTFAIRVSQMFKLGGKGDPNEIATLLLKLAMAGIIYVSAPLIYAMSMSIMASGAWIGDALNQFSDSSAGAGPLSRMVALARTDTLLTPELADLRNKGIQQAVQDRAGIFTYFVATPEVDKPATDFWAYFLNQLAAARTYGNTYGISVFTTTVGANTPGARTYTPLPRLLPDGADASTGGPYTDLETLRGLVVRRFLDLTLDSSNIPTSSSSTSGSADYTAMTLNWTFGNYTANHPSYTVTALSDDIQTATADIVTAIKATDGTDAGVQAKNALEDQFQQVVRQTTDTWIDGQMIDVFVSCMDQTDSFVGPLQSIASSFQRVGLSALNTLTPSTALDGITKVLSVGVYAVKKIVIPFIMKCGSFIFRLINEIALLGLLLALPFWFLDGTKKAFTGAAETLLTTALIIPFWQFFQFLFDAVYTAISAMIVGAGAPLVAGVAIATAGSGLATMTLALAGVLAFGYFCGSIYLAFKVPGMVKGFLSGAGWVTGVLSAAAVGGVAAVAAAVVGGAAAGGAIAAGTGGAGAFSKTIAGAGKTAFSRMGARAGNAGRMFANRAFGHNHSMQELPQYEPNIGKTLSKTATFRGVKHASSLFGHIMMHQGDAVKGLQSHWESQKKKNDGK